MKDQIKIAYLGGGSRGWARTFMVDLAKENAFRAEVNLYDIDFAAAKDNETIANRLFAREDVVGKHSFKAVETLEDALTGVDFVVISVLPGTFNEMRSDVHTPEKYGIYQSVGDTSGPGGILRAMRTVPIFKGFAEAIKKYCPKAWVINYTNPMSMCVKALYEVFPEIKAFGCCHEVFGTQSVLAGALNWDKQVAISKLACRVSTTLLGLLRRATANTILWKVIKSTPITTTKRVCKRTKTTIGKPTRSSVSTA